MTNCVIGNMTTALWHNKFAGEMVFLRNIEADIHGLQTNTQAPFPVALGLSGHLPDAERLIDIKKGDYIEIHWKRRGRPDEYSIDALYMSIRVFDIEPMLISHIVAYYPPEEHASASIRLLGNCEIYRKLSDE